jgi:pyruvate formate lyase activating enzyme
MKILGYIPTSFSDWDGKLASVLFVGGCNYNCPFCQNYRLLVSAQPQQTMPWETIAPHMKNRKSWLDGVVISGGEPLLHPEIFGLCAEIRRLGFPVKVDTNGSFPFVLMKLHERRLLDYVALDIKSALDERYTAACGGKVELGLVMRSLRFLLEGKLEYELRTTLVPGLVGKDEIRAIARKVKGARRYALQQFVPDNARTAAYRKKKPYKREKVEEFAAILKPVVGEVILRGKMEE